MIEISEDKVVKVLISELRKRQKSKDIVCSSESFTFLRKTLVIPVDPLNCFELY